MPIPIKKWWYYKLLKSYNMDKMPRAIGFPNQRYICNYDKLWDFFRSVRGAATCFTSVNSYPKSERIGSKLMPCSISVNSIYSDFDDSEKKENALRDARRLAEFQIREGFPFLSAYSGSKGFANYHILEPHKYKYFANSDSGKALKEFIYGIHVFFKNGFRNEPKFTDKKARIWKLKTMDKMVMKDPKRLCRMMYSPHSTMEGHLTGRYCYPLTAEQLLDWDLYDIERVAYNPPLQIPDTTTGRRWTLVELSRLLEINHTEMHSGIEICEESDKDLEIAEQDTKMLLYMLHSTKPCITNQLKGYNPDHFIRFCFIVYIKRLGKSITDAVAHYKSTAEHFKYLDRANTEERDKQIEHIYGGNYVSEPTCAKLIRDGYCLGDKCPKFRKVWNGREHQELKR